MRKNNFFRPKDVRLWSAYILASPVGKGAATAVPLFPRFV